MRRLWLVLGLAACGGSLEVESEQFGLKVCPKGAVTNGVDVSHYDGTIDWVKAHAAGIDFAIMKATETTSYVDPTFATNWKGAHDAGVIRGAYHFFRANADGATQADWFLKTAGMPQPGDLPPTLDLETTDGVPVAQVAQVALAFLARIHDVTGVTPMVYTSPSFFDSTLMAPAGFDSYLLWVANWGVSCPSIPQPPWNDWVIWQNSATGTVNGIPGSNGAVDLDQYNGSLSDLMNWLNPPAPDGGVNDTDMGGATADLSEPAAIDAAIAHPMPHGGCSCQLAASGAQPWWPLAALMLLALRSRRSRR